MSNNKWLFPHSQKVATSNTIKNISEVVMLRSKQRAAKIKTVFPSIEDILSKLVVQNYLTEEFINEAE